jgi:hypothetical protein
MSRTQNFHSGGLRLNDVGSRHPECSFNLTADNVDSALTFSVDAKLMKLCEKFLLFQIRS